MKKKFKVGFDLDGVILYNPIRIFRKLISDILKPLKKNLFNTKKNKAELFYIPKSKIMRFVWLILHKTSFMISPDYDQLIKISKKKNVELYLITGRYGFLENDLKKWLKKINAKKIFKKVFYNKKNSQPHLFKKNVIQKLNLKYYVEDNWDIVKKLNHKNSKAKIIWLSNIVDRNIPYRLKFFSLKEVCQYLMKLS